MSATVIIPSFNHAQYLPAAIDSALAQTVPCEAIVADDGSTDETADVLAHYGNRIIALHLPHGGPGRARNVALNAASGEFIQFLDADDTIAPDKIERQADELARHPAAGWSFCDTRIIDEARGKVEPASERYGYAAMRLNGNIAPLLDERNFIPVHAPLVRRRAIGALRFGEGALEDWAFWRALAAITCTRYLPEVLCTYHARRDGRNRRSKG